MTHFRLTNLTALPRSEWAPAGLPFAKGALEEGGSVMVEGVTHAFKTLERWNDGSVRRGMIDYPAVLQPYEEKRIEYQPSKRPPVGGFLPAIPAMSISVFVNGVETVFDTYETTFTDATRWEGLSAKFHGTSALGLTLDLYSTAWTGQKFGRVTIVLGNDWKLRTTAAAFPVQDVRIRFNGALAAPLFGHAHNVTTVSPWTEFRLPLAGAIGDGQRWGTAFTWAAYDSNVAHAYGFGTYPLFGYPEPESEDAAQGYGFYGNLRRTALGTSGDPYFTRQFWEAHREFWLGNCPNTTWTGHGYWTQQEGSTGGHPDWGPAPTLPDDLAMTPRGIHRMLQLSLSRLRTPDHYRIDRSDEYPQTGAFNGWLNAPYREPADYGEHIAGSNGWSGSDDAHREETFRLRAYELTGEEWLYRELKATAELACLRAKVGGGYGEGRDMARTLQRKLIYWLIAWDGDRERFRSHLEAWAGYIDAAMPALATPLGPIYGFSILNPGDSKYGTHGFDPQGMSYLFFPWSESHVCGTLTRAATLTGIPAFKGAAEKTRETLARFCKGDGHMFDAVMADGTGRLDRTGNTWAFPGASQNRGTHPGIDAVVAQ